MRYRWTSFQGDSRLALAPTTRARMPFCTVRSAYPGPRYVARILKMFGGRSAAAGGAPRPAVAIRHAADPLDTDAAVS